MCQLAWKRKGIIIDVWGIWEHMGGWFLHVHAKWIKTRDIWPWRILIYTLELELWHFKVCLHREAKHLQYFMHMHCVINGEYPLRSAHITLTTFTQFDRNWSTGCLLALYGHYASSSTTWRCGLLVTHEVEKIFSAEIILHWHAEWGQNNIKTKL